MAWSKALAAVCLIVWLAGCAQGRDSAAARSAAHEPPRAPVPTLGPDDGVPFPNPATKAARTAPARPASAAGDSTDGAVTQHPAER